MMKFGTLRWPETPAAKHALEWTPRAAVMTVVTCGHCDEAIGMEEGGFILPTFGNPQFTPYHELCFMRTVLGSLSHQRKLCSCYVKGGPEGDPPGMTKRQAARASVYFFQQQE